MTDDKRLHCFYKSYPVSVSAPVQSFFVCEKAQAETVPPSPPPFAKAKEEVM